MKHKPGAVVRRCGAALAAVAFALALFGCGDGNGSSRQLAALRLIDASPDTGGIDIYANSTALTYNVGFGNVSSYIIFAPGTYTLATRATGTTTVLASMRGTLAANGQYTLLIGNVAAGLQTTLLQDQAQPAPAGQVALRVVDQSTRAGALDVYLVAQGGSLLTTVPLLTGLTFNNASSAPHYLNVPAGAYSLIVVPTGTVPAATTVTSYTGAVVSYPSGSARTVILLDQPLVKTPGVQVVIANDYDAATAVS